MCGCADVLLCCCAVGLSPDRALRIHRVIHRPSHLVQVLCLPPALVMAGQFGRGLCSCCPFLRFLL